jgi:hypothetical protein
LVMVDCVLNVRCGVCFHVIKIPDLIETARKKKRFFIYFFLKKTLDKMRHKPSNSILTVYVSH